MPATDPTAELPPRPDPPMDRPGKPVPPQIDAMLALLQLLLTYGRHLSQTLERRASSRTFSTIAQAFGTIQLPLIGARLARGLLRIQALQLVLALRAARGRDLVFLKPRRLWQKPDRTADPAPPAAPPATAPDSAPPRRQPRRRPTAELPADPNALPTLEQLMAEIRRRPLGCAVADICRDLGIAPGLCHGNLWNVLFQAIHWYRGNVARLARDFHQREAACVPEWDMDPNLDIPEETRDGTRRVLGFFIGETPVVPDWMAALPGEASATGPP